MSNELERLGAEAASADALAAEQNKTPGQAEAEQAARVARDEGIEKEAAALTDLAAQAVEALWPAVGISPDTRQKFAGKLAPVLKKHNLSSLFGRWAEEFDLGIFFCGLAYGGYKAVQADKVARGAQGSGNQAKPDGGE